MAVSSVSINPPPSSSVGSILSNFATPFAEGAKSSVDKQVSATVTLSAQGQRLSQTQANQTNQPQTSQSQASNGANTAVAENVEPQSKEIAEPAGIQFMEGESKGGRVNTYA